jgi:glucose/mannose-6-phosphate isomerase
MIDRAADRSNMYQIIKDFPRQFAKGVNFAAGVRAKRSFNRVIVAGMGGSAFPGDIVKAYLGEKMIPIAVSRDYSLPPPVDSETLVICSSFSGNTEETISSLHDALDGGAQVVTITTGGRLGALSEEHDLPIVRLDKEVPHMQPRASTGYIVAACLTVLANSTRLIPDRSQELIALGQYLEGRDFEQRAMEMAEKLVDHVPIIYSSSRHGDTLARIIKIKFNENCKTQAFYNVFPELNHNEMVGFTHVRARYCFILLRDDMDHQRVRRRMDVFADLFRDRKIPVIHVHLEGDTFLQRTFGTLYLFDWVSYYLALRYGVDPTPVEMVEDFKGALGPFTAE